MRRERRKLTALLFALAGLLAFAGVARSQVVVDRTVATVSDGVRTELITYSDLIWQLALQPGVPLQPPRPEDLKRALQTQIDQRIFALEAQRLPRAAATEAELKEAIVELVDEFPVGEFERRLRSVGFDSVSDDNFEAIIAQRIAIEKYLDFRFRSFVVITADDEATYYRESWVPAYKQRNPAAIVPELDSVRGNVQKQLTEDRVARSIEQFLEEAKRRVTVTILYEV